MFQGGTAVLKMCPYALVLWGGEKKILTPTICGNFSDTFVTRVVRTVAKQPDQIRR